LECKDFGYIYKGDCTADCSAAEKQKSALKLSGLDARSSLSLVTHGSLQINFHLVVDKLGCRRLWAELLQLGCFQGSSLAGSALILVFLHMAGCSVGILLGKASALLIL